MAHGAGLDRGCMFQGKKSAFGKDYDFFNPLDPAFDQGSEDYNPDLWAETGDDKHLPVKGGMAPWRFVLRRLTGREKGWIRDRAADGGNTAAWWCIAMSLRKCVSPDGAEEIVGTAGYRGQTVATDEWLDAIAEDKQLFNDMAWYIITKELTPDPK